MDLTFNIAQHSQYANREHKPLYDIEDYDVVQIFPNIVSFCEHDGVETSVVINADHIDGDYLVVTDDTGNILSRWFVMEANQVRLGQYRVGLRRDLLVDFKDGYKNGTFFCRRGALTAANDPLSYLSEGQSFNQILQSRTPLKQFSSGDPKQYIVGYIDKTWGGGDIYYKPGIKYYNDLEDYPYADALDGTKQYVRAYNMRRYIGGTFVNAPLTDPLTAGPTYSFKFRSNSDDMALIHATGVTSYKRNGTNTADPTGAAMRTACSKLAQQFDYLIMGKTNVVPFSGEVGTYYCVIDGKPKKVVITQDENLTTVASGSFNDAERSAFDAAWNDVVPGGYKGQDSTSVIAQEYPSWTVEGYKITITMTDADSTDIPRITIPANRAGVSTLPYDIFVIDNTNAGREFAGYFASQYAAAHVLYDLQLLPLRPDVTESGKISIAAGTDLKWATSDSIEGTFYHAAIATYTTEQDKKVGANCDMCRIVAPQMGAMWEFNPAEIGGVAANSIRYEATFLPYSPYIHIFPHFGGIYGSINKSASDQKTGETRGIVCGGDYSIPYSTDGWASYKLNNSSYEDAFNRQIENMSITQNVERANQVIGAGVSAITAGVSAGVLNPIAGIATGIASAAAGAADYAISEKLRAEQMNYAKDQFGYSMRNIKAQASPLAKTNSAVIGNAVCPFIEYYTAPTAEKTIFKNRLEKRGYTIGAMTSFAIMELRASAEGALSKWIQGDLLTVTANDMDAHLVLEIKNELQQGVYV